MLTKLVDPVLSLDGRVILLVVGLIVLAEAALMVGFVLPGEAAVLLGGVAASRGSVPLPALIGVVVVSAIVGDSVGYLVGRRFGPRIIRSKALRNRRHHVEAVSHRLNKNGGTIVFVARFGAFLRAVVPGLCGNAGVPYTRFAVANAAGGIVWGVSCSLVGYFAGSAYQRIESASSKASLAIFALVVVVVLVLRLRGRRRTLERSVAEGQPTGDLQPRPVRAPDPPASNPEV